MYFLYELLMTLRIAIQTPRVIYQTREGVLHPIFYHREVEYQTLEGLFHLVMQTPRKRLKIQDTAECNKANLNF